MDVGVRMKQQTLALAAGFERFGRQTRRSEFLSQMDVVVPWSELVALIEPHYPKAGNGRPPVGLERMLRIYFLQQWFNLSDPAVEDALYDSLTMRSFVGIDLGREPAPDETTVCKFRHLLERHGLGRKMLAVVNGHLERHGLKIGTGTIVDATILHAPSSTRNKQEQRDPEMHQVKKGNQWYFGMKAHVGVDADTKLIHSAEATAANVADNRVLADLLHGEETEVWGDQAYQGKTEVIVARAPQAVDRTHRQYRTKLVCYPAIREENRVKSKTRSRVEHVFALIKLKFGFAKVRYRGLEKNRNRLLSLCALTNLLTARHHLMAVAGQSCA
ncbi:transposase, IS5 family [Granulicella rosea]|uniref:Transposase, IS4 family n=2 Tax=Granulicella rosea TaxID=474952 RepID=A0A239DSM5_9BACT|nr:transposase, IS4 family [Granulicella rosea]SNS36524.1 transposase, IS5 family [Granulicella rosea]